MTKPPVGSTIRFVSRDYRATVTSHTERGFTYKGEAHSFIPRLGLSFTGEGEIYTDQPMWDHDLEVIPRSSTETLITALRVLARDIKSGDGVANAAIAEAADRLEELAKDSIRLDRLSRCGVRVRPETEDEVAHMELTICMGTGVPECPRDIRTAIDAAPRCQ